MEGNSEGRRTGEPEDMKPLEVAKHAIQMAEETKCVRAA